MGEIRSSLWGQHFGGLSSIVKVFNSSRPSIHTIVQSLRLADVVQQVPSQTSETCRSAEHLKSGVFPFGWREKIPKDAGCAGRRSVVAAASNFFGDGSSPRPYSRDKEMRSAN